MQARLQQLEQSPVAFLQPQEVLALRLLCRSSCAASKARRLFVCSPTEEAVHAAADLLGTQVVQELRQQGFTIIDNFVGGECCTNFISQPSLTNSSAVPKKHQTMNINLPCLLIETESQRGM